MKKLLLTSCLALGITSGLYAGTITASGTVGAAAAGAYKENFNAFALGNGTQSSGALTVEFSGIGAGVVQNSVNNQYAAPFLSGANGNGFGGGAGLDPTRYLTTGIGIVTFTFASEMDYFGLLWGSIDTFNSLDFWNGADHVVTVSGTDALFAAHNSGDQGVAGTFYVNLFADLGVHYDKVVATSGNYAFEIDNVAYGLNLGVPDSGATVALLGLSFACLFFFRRKAA